MSHPIVSLQAHHPSMPIEDVAAALGMEPNGGWSAGQARTTPVGRPLGGTRDETYAYVKLGGDGPLETTLVPTLADLSSPSASLSEFHASGGALVAYVSFDKRDRGASITHETVAALAKANVGLAIDWI